MVKQYNLDVKWLGTTGDKQRVYILNGHYVVVPAGIVIQNAYNGIQFMARNGREYVGSSSASSKLDLYPAYVKAVKLLEPHGIFRYRLVRKAETKPRWFKGVRLPAGVMVVVQPSCLRVVSMLPMGGQISTACYDIAKLAEVVMEVHSAQVGMYNRYMDDQRVSFTEAIMIYSESPL